MSATNKLNCTAGNGLFPFTWPQDSTGWGLQGQTNPPDIGPGTNWVTEPGSFCANHMFLLMNPASGSVFFRLTNA
jgi:hypothetical protein